MTQFTTIEAPIRDLVALIYACVALNLDLVPDAWCRGHGGTVLQAAFVRCNLRCCKKATGSAR